MYVMLVVIYWSLYFASLKNQIIGNDALLRINLNYERFKQLKLSRYALHIIKLFEKVLY